MNNVYRPIIDLLTAKLKFEHREEEIEKELKKIFGEFGIDIRKEK